MADQDTYTESDALALLPFAQGWLERWTSHGGSVMVGAERVATIGHPEYSFSPDCVRDQLLADQLAEQEWFKNMTPVDQTRHASERWTWNSTFFAGKMRELSDLLDAVPGGVGAVKALVNGAPELGLSANSPPVEA